MATHSEGDRRKDDNDLPRPEGGSQSRVAGSDTDCGNVQEQSTASNSFTV